MASNYRMNRRHVLQGIGAGTLAVAAPHVLRAQTAPNVMKIGTLTLNDVQHEWMKLFAAQIESESQGRIKPELYTAGQLGSAARSIEGVQFGSIQMFVVPPEFLSGVDSRYEVLSAPGIFNDVAHANRTLLHPEFNKAFLALGANKGIKGVGLFISDWGGFATRTKVEKLADFAGKKIRVLASPMQTEQLKKVNATAVPMSLGEVLPALQQGTIDGVMSALPVVTPLRFYDSAKYFLMSEHTIVTVISIASKQWYDKLPKDLQEVIDRAGQKASVDAYKWAADFSVKQQGVWTGAGGVISKLSKAEHDELMKMMRTIGPEITAKKPDEKALFDLMLKTAASVA